jgi:hypothetical protein
MRSFQIRNLLRPGLTEFEEYFYADEQNYVNAQAYHVY